MTPYITSPHRMMYPCEKEFYDSSLVAIFSGGFLVLPTYREKNPHSFRHANRHLIISCVFLFFFCTLNAIVFADTLCLHFLCIMLAIILQEDPSKNVDVDVDVWVISFRVFSQFVFSHLFPFLSVVDQTRKHFS